MFSKIFSLNKKDKQITKPSRVVGIDMGSSAIKVVELEERSGIVTLVNYGELQTAPYAERSVGESVTLDPSSTQEALLELYQAAAIKAKSAVFAMPLSSSFVTVINLPVGPDDDDDLSARIRVEARKYIPLPMNKVTLDWLDLGILQSSESDSEIVEKEILVAAIQNTALQQSKEILDMAGFHNTPTEIECFSTIRAMYKENLDYSAVIDIGAVYSKLYILKNGVIQRIHRARGGGALATAQFAAEKDITFVKAEDIKKLLDPKNEDYISYKKNYHKQLERVMKEFAKVISDYQKTTNSNISLVELTGGGALFPKLTSYISDSLQIQTILSTPFNQVAYPAFMEDTLNNIGPTFTVALGAALRTFE